MLLQHSRRDARVVDGRLVLLPDQDRSRWHRAEIAEALDLLRPWVGAPASPYLLQALIAAEHAIAADRRRTPPGTGSCCATRSWRRSPAHRSSGSTARSRSPRRPDPPPASRCSTG